MRVFHFTEQPYPDAWKSGVDSLRVTLPNEMCDPQIAADLYHRYHDEWMLADELGFDIMVNEHHSTATCLSASCNITLAILARITKRAKLLALGVPLANRTDPLRVAEELSMIDVISRGRLIMGFVKGVPVEVFIANSNPVRMMDRLWEAHDFIIKAMTHRDGPFNWEGRYFQYRNVNVWPRPWQQPHPEVWITATSLGSAAPLGERGVVMATFLTGYRLKEMYQRYRDAWRKARGTQAPTDRFAYLALAAVASTEQEALRRAHEVARYITTTGFIAEPFRNPPGYGSVEDNAKMLKQTGRVPRLVPTRDGRMINVMGGEVAVRDLIDAGLMFAGTPDQVYQQIIDFDQKAGGIGNLLLMMQGGALNHAETVDSLSLFGKEVLPRLREHKTAALVPESDGVAA
jgi:alkanesulfonate monooxygenase SsuD/methylene tetrahydromethanopterin reductase-like flavin-dependent oxidoreductase (luciferase family)